MRGKRSTIVNKLEPNFQKLFVTDVLNKLSINDTRTIEDDIDLITSDKKSMVAHNKQYTQLLKAYVDNANETLKSKRKWKFAFFLYSLLLLGTITIAIIIFSFIVYANSNDTVVDIISVSTVALSFLSTIIVIPNVITQYLFNLEEEKNMSEIIGNLQKYDLSIRENGMNSD